MQPRRPLLARLLMLVAAGVSLAGCRSPDDAERGAPVADLLEVRPRIVTESRFLRFGAGNRRHLGRGWHGNEWNRALERHFVWAHGRNATVDLRILQVLDLQFLLELSPVPSERRQRIDVSVNGEPVTSIDPVPGFSEYRFLVPARHLRRGRNTLVFDHAVVGPPPRRLAAGYSWILLGPECLRLRPDGRPPAPPRVRRRAGRLEVRGPAEMTWTVTPPDDARLRLRAEVGKEPVRLTVDVVEGAGSHRVGDVRLTPPWLGDSVTRAVAFDLSPWGGRPVALRIGVAPEPCGSAFAEASLVEASLFGKTIDKASGLSR